MPRHLRSSAEIASIMSRLTPRDGSIISLLGDHDVLTTHQIYRAHFTSLARAQSRLLSLYRTGLLERFRAAGLAGSQQWHWVLSPLGARLHAATTGAAPPRPGRVTDKMLRLASTTTLTHTLGCNDFFVRILAAIRNRPWCDLTNWASEETLPAGLGRRIRPDATATFTENDRSIAFWFEHDRGTETQTTLTSKADRYRDATILTEPRAVLFELPNAAREAHLHNHLAGRHIGFPLATTHAQLATDPTAAVWRILHAGPGRVRLIDIQNGFA